MTVIYGNAAYHLSDESVTVQPPDGHPHPVDATELPLPVARVLAAWRLQAPLHRAA